MTRRRPRHAGARRSFGPVDRAEAGGVVDELHQEVVLLRVGIVDQEPRVDTAAGGLEAVPRVPASDPPPSRDHPPPVRIAPEQLDDADQSSPAVNVVSPRYGHSGLLRQWGMTLSTLFK